MLEALARQANGRFNVFCVNPPRGLGEYLAAASWPAMSIQQVADNLTVVTPPVMVPKARWHPWLADLRKRALSRSLTRTLVKLTSPEARNIAWVYKPEQQWLQGLVSEMFTVYECYDAYWEQVKLLGEDTTHFDRVERQFVQKVDLILATSLVLYQHMQGKYGKAHYTPNGVDYDLFAGTDYDHEAIPSDLSGIPSPRIGTVGNVSDIIDFELVEFCVRSKPDWSFVFIGPVNGPVPTRVRDSENVFFLGRRERGLVPQYIRGLDVVWIPFKKTPFTDPVDPLRLWESLAVGKAVVSTNIQEAKNLLDTVPDLEKTFFAEKDYATFLARLEALVRIPGSLQMKAMRQSIAKRRSWANLGQDVLNIIEEHLNT